MATIQMTEKMYSAVVEQFYEEIIRKGFYKADVQVEVDGVLVEFIASLILYWKSEDWGDCDMLALDDVIPAWWECHTSVKDKHGDWVEVINDATWRNFLTILTDN